jgi:hypothetical protein
MDRHGHRRWQSGREPHGFLPRATAMSSPWRQLREWLPRGRQEIDQQGLLAERTLLIAPRRMRREERGPDAGAVRSGPDEAPR